MGKKRKLLDTHVKQEVENDIENEINTNHNGYESSRKKAKSKYHLDPDIEKNINMYEEEIKEEEEEDTNSQFINELDNSVDVSEWSKEDMTTLLNKIRPLLPKNDSVRYNNTLKQLNWEQIRFGTFTAEECKLMAQQLVDQCRKYRTMTEMLVDMMNIVIKGQGRDASGRVQHPDMPKRPMTPFLRFFSEKRSKYQELYPEMSPTELSKFMSSKFYELSEKKQIKYRRKFDAEMAEYKENVAKFRAEHPELYAKSGGDGAPEKPRLPFNLFTKKRTKKYLAEGNLNKREVYDLVRQEWLNLSDKKRAKWINKSLQDRQRYEEELKEYMKEHPDYKPPRVWSRLGKSERKIQSTVCGRPEKPLNSGYLYFSKRMLEEISDRDDIAPKEKMQFIANKWRELSEKQRKKYNDEATNEQKKYRENFEAYLQKLPPELRALEKNSAGFSKTVKNDANSNKDKPAEKQSISSTAFMLYNMDLLVSLPSEYPNLSKEKLNDLIKKKWLELSHEERLVYQEKAESLGEYMPEFAKPVTTKKYKTKKNAELADFCKRANIKLPPRNGFVLFCIETSKVDETSNSKIEFKEKSQLWKNLNETKKQQYIQRAKEMNDEFKVKLASYKSTGLLPEPSSKKLSSPSKVKIESDISDN